MNPMSAASGAIGAAVRSVLGWMRNRRAQKDKGLPPPEFQWGRFIESVIEGAIVGLPYPEPISAAVLGYFGSDALGKGARLTPLRHVLPRNEK